MARPGALRTARATKSRRTPSSCFVDFAYARALSPLRTYGLPKGPTQASARSLRYPAVPCDERGFSEGAHYPTKPNHSGLLLVKPGLRAVGVRPHGKYWCGRGVLECIGRLSWAVEGGYTGVLVIYAVPLAFCCVAYSFLSTTAPKPRYAKAPVHSDVVWCVGGSCIHWSP